MAIVRVENVRMAGVASSVPDFVRTVDDDVERFQSEDFRKIGASIGVTSRRIAPAGVCSSDLCVAAAERLLEKLNWDRESIQAVLFVTQTPDYPAPATACTLQNRLGLSTGCAAMDINLGCSGYVYGLATAAQFVHGMAGGIEHGGRVLLLVGDTITHFVSPDDRATAPLFGDAGSATALEYSSSAEPIVFSLGTDGRGLNHLIVPAGGARQPRSAETGVRTARESGNIRSDEDMYMNGAEVFSFALQEVPRMVRSTLAEAGWSIDEVDGVIMHQSNGIMLNHLRKRLKIDEEKFVIALEGYGNASCASIPLAMTHRWAQTEPSEKRRLVLAGFGLGWSWGGAAVTCENMVMPELVIYETPKVDETAGAGTAGSDAKEAA
jgi:3-oxoacyl-[acyl-carrier-protein] synthase III